jgi:hypothetical protein
MVVVACALAAYGVSIGGEGRSEMPRPARRWPLVAGIALAAWSLGANGFTARALWGVLPLAAAIGVFSRRTVGLGGGILWGMRGILAALAWTVLAVVLFQLGSRHSEPRPENYYYTFAALAAALAWREILRKLLRSRVAASGNVDFAASLAAMVLLVGAVLLKRDFAAQLAALVVYFLAVLGALREMLTPPPAEMAQRNA